METQPTEERMFWPRGSEVMEHFGHQLSAPPERSLLPEQKREVLDFEHRLFHGQAEGLCAPESMADMPVHDENAFSCAPEYFLTVDGRAWLADHLGIELSADATVDAVTTGLRGLSFDELQHDDNEATYRQLQSKSLNYLKARYAHMARGEEPLRDIATISITKDPNVLLGKVANLWENKQFLRQVRAQLRSQQQSDMRDAKLMITDIYRDKLNAMLAESYPSVMSLQAQLAVHDDAGEAVLASYERRIPMLLTTARAAAADPERRAKFVRMLDYVRNGATTDSQGNLTPIDESIFAAVDDINQRPPTTDDARFTPEEIAEFEHMIFDAVEMQTFLNAYMERIGLADEGWTTEIRVDSNTFGVNSLRQKVNIAGSYRSAVAQAFPATGVVGLTEHEVGGRRPGHVIQSVNLNHNPSALAIATSPKFRGKRNGSMREAGGLDAEADAMQYYFGQSRRYNSSYAVAMATLLQGGHHADAVRAFAQSQLAGRERPTTAEIDAAYAMGADRVMRLLRYGGRNSQPLQYVEAARVRQVTEYLPEELIATMFAEAALDPVDMLRLHQFGLLETTGNQRFTPAENPDDIIVDLLRAYAGARQFLG